MAKKLELNKNK